MATAGYTGSAWKTSTTSQKSGSGQSVMFGSTGTSVIPGYTTTATFNPVHYWDPYWFGAQDTWANVSAKSANGENYGDPASNIALAVYSGGATSNRFTTLGRALFVFNTSSIGAGKTVIAATLKAYVNSYTNGTGWNGLLRLTPFTPATPGVAARGDFSNVGSTNYGDSAAMSGGDLNTYFSIPLNAAGMAGVSLTGYTNLAVRLKDDVAGTTPGWANASTSIIAASGTSGSPVVLEVTYA